MACLRAVRQVVAPVAATVGALGGVLVSGAELDSNPALHAGAHTDRGGGDALRCETASCCLTVKLS